MAAEIGPILCRIISFGNSHLEIYFIGNEDPSYLKLQLKFCFSIGGMDGRFQNKAAGDSETNEYQNKRSAMTLNVNGLWDVVPRLDHYRLVQNQIFIVNKKYKRKFVLLKNIY